MHQVHGNVGLQLPCDVNYPREFADQHKTHAKALSVAAAQTGLAAMNAAQVCTRHTHCIEPHELLAVLHKPYSDNS